MSKEARASFHFLTIHTTTAEKPFRHDFDFGFSASLSVTLPLLLKDNFKYLGHLFDAVLFTPALKPFPKGNFISLGPFHEVRCKRRSWLAVAPGTLEWWCQQQYAAAVASTTSASTRTTHLTTSSTTSYAKLTVVMWSALRHDRRHRALFSFRYRQGLVFFLALNACA